MAFGYFSRSLSLQLATRVSAPGCPDSRHANAAAIVCQSWYLAQSVSSSARTLPGRALIRSGRGGSGAASGGAAGAAAAAAAAARSSSAAAASGAARAAGPAGAARAAARRRHGPPGAARIARLGRRRTPAAPRIVPASAPALEGLPRGRGAPDQGRAAAGSEADQFLGGASGGGQKGETNGKGSRWRRARSRSARGDGAARAPARAGAGLPVFTPCTPRHAARTPPRPAVPAGGAAWRGPQDKDEPRFHRMCVSGETKCQRGAGSSGVKAAEAG
jgi:hypothetical protein